MVSIDWLKGVWHASPNRLIGFDIAFGCNSTITRTIIKKFLITHGYFAYSCSICGLSEWNNVQIPLELDHINGINNDNRLVNIRLLCPNCHSLTDTFSRKIPRTNRLIPAIPDTVVIDTIKNTQNPRQALITLGLQPYGGNYDRIHKLKREYQLEQCNAHVNSKRPTHSELLNNLIMYGVTVYHASLYNASIKSLRKWLRLCGLPSTKRELFKLISDTNATGDADSSLNEVISFSESKLTSSIHSKKPTKSELLESLKTIVVVSTIADKYGVSDNAIRKWLKSYNLPTKLNDIKSMCVDSVRKIKSRINNACGSGIGTSKLTEVDVINIRSLYETGHHSHRSLAAKFGVGHRAIGDILSNKTWVHVSVQ